MFYMRAIYIMVWTSHGFIMCALMQVMTSHEYITHALIHDAFACTPIVLTTTGLLERQHEYTIHVHMQIRNLPSYMGALYSTALISHRCITCALI